jgi:hypothetical protein
MCFVKVRPRMAVDDSWKHKSQFIQLTSASKLSPELHCLREKPSLARPRVTQVQSTHDGATAVKQRNSFKSLNSNYITSRALRSPSCKHNTFTYPSQQNHSQTANMVYTLVVHLYAKDDAESISKLVTKLQEASQVYSNDKETLGW